MLRLIRQFLLLVSFFFIFQILLRPSYSQEPRSSSAARDQKVQQLAIWALHEAPAMGCPATNCKVLVPDFILPDGQSCAYGVQLADEFSEQFISLQKDIQVIDRHDMRKFVEFAPFVKDVPIEGNVARWVADVFGADVIFEGRIKQNKDEIELSVRLLRMTTREPTELMSESGFVDARADLSPLKSSPSLFQEGVLVRGEMLYGRSLQGLSGPSCFYMPNPPSTAEATAARFNGIVEVLGIVAKDGHIGNFLVVKTPGMGLTESTLNTMQTWKCKPARFKGQPVPYLVTFEVNFHENWK